MWEYTHYDELMHYGVKGMKWGVRRTYDVKKAAYKKQRKEYSRAFDKAYNRSAAGLSPIKKHRQANDARWKDAADKAEKYYNAKSEYRVAKKALKADVKAKKAAEKALAKVEKQKYKDFVKERSKEILAGESIVGKIWDVYTGEHKYQAMIEYDIDKRAKVNKAYRD